jgi:hypothetical protein
MAVNINTNARKLVKLHNISAKKLEKKAVAKSALAVLR